MLSAHELSFRFAHAAPPVLEDFSIAIAPGEIVGLTGPSGQGKSTLARLLCRHLVPQRGHVALDGAPLPEKGFCPVQLLAQAPIFAVNPRWSVGRIISEAWTPDEASRTALGIRSAWLERYPHELSGGELQRVAILRSLAPGLRYLVADEITAMLDPIAQAEIWGFLARLAREREVGILAISHDRALLGAVAGRTVEMGLTTPDRHRDYDRARDRADAA